MGRIDISHVFSGAISGIGLKADETVPIIQICKGTKMKTLLFAALIFSAGYGVCAFEHRGDVSQQAYAKEIKQWDRHHMADLAVASKAEIRKDIQLTLVTSRCEAAREAAHLSKAFSCEAN